MKLTIGSQIVMPEPNGTDDCWKYGGFLGTVIGFRCDGSLATIRDADEDCFDIEIDRAEKAMVDENNL